MEVSLLLVIITYIIGIAILKPFLRRKEFMKEPFWELLESMINVLLLALLIKLSKFGAFIGCSNYPKCDYTINLSNEPYTAETTEQDDSPKEKNLGEDIFFRIGKYGPYVTNGTKNASAKKYTIDNITLEIARELLNNDKKKAEPIILGKNPETDKPIYYYQDGRYGPYLSSNRVNVSVKEQPDLETAINLINNKKSKKAK